MRRRQLLGALATTVGAGCGYAAGAGDDRGRVRIGDELPGIGNLQVDANDSIVIAYREQPPTALPSLEHEPRLGVYDWTGDLLATVPLESSARTVAVGDRIAVHTEDGLAVSVSVDRLDMDEGIAWRVPLEERATLVGTRESLAFVRSPDGLRAFAGGTAAWTATFDRPVTEATVTAEHVVASDGRTVRGFDHDGTERWASSVVAADLAGRGRYTVLHAAGTITLLADGKPVWERAVGPVASPPRLAADLVLVLERTGHRRGRRLIGIDRDRGKDRFAIDGVADIEGPVAASEDGVVLVDDRCVVRHVRDGRVAWRRSLDRGTCRVRAARIEADRVALLFADGHLIRFQRVAEQPRGWAP